MVLEATYLCVDNSDYMRNGDFAPSRMEAQPSTQQAITRCAGLPRDASPSDARRGRLCMYGVTGRAVAAPSCPPSRAAHSGLALLTA